MVYNWGIKMKAELTFSELQKLMDKDGLSSVDKLNAIINKPGAKNVDKKKSL